MSDLRNLTVRPFLTAALVLAAGCAPRLYSDGSGDLDWVAPDNRWEKAQPPDTLTGEGFSVGQVALDVRGLDQHGDEVSLWQFYGKLIVLDIATMWCGPCQELGRSTESFNAEYADRGVLHLTVLLENEDGVGPTQEELEKWATLPSLDADSPYDLITSPILSDPKGESGSIRAVRNNQYPVPLLVGRDMRILERIAPVTKAAIEDAVDEALAAE